MAQSIQSLRALALAAQREGAPDVAERLHRQIVADWPDALESWDFLCVAAAKRGDFAASAEALQHYLDIEDCSASAWRSLGIAEMQEKKWVEALAAFQEALKLEPDVRVNLIYVGGAAIKAGQQTLAADSLSLALQGIPADELAADGGDIEPVLAEILDEAVQFLEDYLAELISDGEELSGQLKGASWRLHETSSPEWNDHRQRPGRFFMSAIAPQPWYDLKEFPWGEKLEAAYSDIRHEVTTALSHADASPYIAGHTLEAQHWDSLADNDDWTAVHLYSGGYPNARQAAKFPKTLAALKGLPICQKGGNPVEVFFSLLAPGGHIVPHYGTSNARLTAHLPILVPRQKGAATVSVGGITRDVEPGKLMTFDDSFRHEARNDGDSLRINLIFEVWNPALSQSEVKAVEAMNERFNSWFMGRGRRMAFLGATLAEAVQANNLYENGAEALYRDNLQEGERLMRQALCLNPDHKRARRYFEDARQLG
ncbi:MAG: aspartyl/asparaginyl beta-hydroxylase domain-containing protein [Alphaproteobacteria bacterium]|nr:aspartyl/asparaginyl beta-hydroxylase domain-containing protein [Alphaproteobacteria bacterium]